MKQILVGLFLICTSTPGNAQMQCPTDLSIGGKSDTLQKKLLTFPMAVIVHQGELQNKCPDGLVVQKYKVKIPGSGSVTTLAGSGSAFSPEIITALRKLPANSVFYVTQISATDARKNVYQISDWSFVIK
jgi:hypothetical protein